MRLILQGQREEGVQELLPFFSSSTYESHGNDISTILLKTIFAPPAYISLIYSRHSHTQQDNLGSLKNIRFSRGVYGTLEGRRWIHWLMR